MSRLPLPQGFTLIELIIVIVISGIIAVGSSRFIAHTSAGYVATGIRQGNASIGTVVTEKISRELRSALPNSVRVSSDNRCVEFVPILAGSKYLQAPIKPMPATNQISAFGNGALSAISSGRVAIYATRTDHIYQPLTSQSYLTPADASINGGTITLAAVHQFPTDSPGRRFYVVDTPVSFCYAVVGGQQAIFRYSGYGFQASQPTPPSGGSSFSRDLLVNRIKPAAKLFDYQPASLVRNALVRMSFHISTAVSYDSSEESLKIDQEVQIRNVP